MMSCNITTDKRRGVGNIANCGLHLNGKSNFWFPRLTPLTAMFAALNGS